MGNTIKIMFAEYPNEPTIAIVLVPNFSLYLPHKGEVKNHANAENPKIIDVEYNYERSIENGLDPAHNEFVHPTHGFSGAKNDYKVNPTKITKVDRGADFEQLFDAAPPLDEETYGETARKSDGDQPIRAQTAAVKAPVCICMRYTG